MIVVVAVLLRVDDGDESIEGSVDDDDEVADVSGDMPLPCLVFCGGADRPRVEMTLGGRCKKPDEGGMLNMSKTAM